MSKNKKAEHETEAPAQAAQDEALDEAVEPDETADTPEPEPDPLDVLTGERDDFKDRWLRAVAEQDNVRKRARREVSDANRFAVIDLLRDLLEVLDNFERAAASAAGDEAAEARGLRSGFDLIHGRFQEILTGRGLETVPAETGQPFDPAIHEAVMRIESDDVDSGGIVEVAQKGYRLEDLVLRPARVVVAQ
ncbi:nucleotide exchange factor GrpE [bacterium]|nr:nucleotide exchange factor GrpE [bacterium]